MVEATVLFSEVIKKLAVNASQAFSEKSIEYLVDREHREQIDFGLAYEDYLNKVYDTYSKSKTILYDDEERKLSSFYVPAKLTRRTSVHLQNDESDKISTRRISKVFEQENKLIITGVGGMGKTMLMKYFCVNAIEREYCIPVFISLRRFNTINIDDKSIEKLIYDQLKIFGFELDYKYFEYSLSRINYLFLFDGYDEIADTKRPALSYGIVDFAKRYSNNSFIVSSRPVDALFGWESFKVFSICHMDRRQAMQLIWKLDFDNQVKKLFMEELDEKLFEKYESFVTVPLLLSILFLTYASNTTLPETLNEFYERAFETLLFKHDRKKVGFERVFQSKLSYSVFRNIFLSFCSLTYFDEMYSFSYQMLESLLSEVSERTKIGFDVDAYINDLVKISCMLIQEGQDYIFIHRSFQEYFAAFHLAKRTDEEQRTFCTSYLNYDSEETEPSKSASNGFSAFQLELKHDYVPVTIDPIFDNYVQFRKWINTVDEYYIDFVGHQKVRAFLVMLESVEPDRFESIVLVPIMKKLYSVYEKQNRDLASAFNKSIVNTFIYGMGVYNQYTNGNLDYTECLSVDELSTLLFFMSKREIDLAVFNGNGILLAQQIEHIDFEEIEVPFTSSGRSPFDSRDKGEKHISKYNEMITGKLMWVFVMALSRYEKLYNKKKTNYSFRELKKSII